MLWDLRGKLELKLPDPAEAVRLAMASEKGPVVLMDVGDNVGGGSSGDSTFILQELIRQKARGWVVVIADKTAAQSAFRSGVNGSFDQMVGGRTDQLHGDPVRVVGRVKSLHDGRYIETAMRHGGGRYWDMGPSAVVEVDGGTRDQPNLLLLTPMRVLPYSLHQLISVGIYPERQKILVVKGTIAPRAAYEPIAARILEVDSGGVAAVNPKRFTYQHVRHPLFGLD
jgi:microcystin degradation protein MlrC